MDRRAFMERLFFGCVLAGLFLGAGCNPKEKDPRLGNQESLWKLAEAKEAGKEPLELDYAKGTPASYRDASLGKADPNFKPKVGGG